MWHGGRESWPLALCELLCVWGAAKCLFGVPLRGTPTREGRHPTHREVHRALEGGGRRAYFLLVCHLLFDAEETVSATAAIIVATLPHSSSVFAVDLL